MSNYLTITRFAPTHLLRTLILANQQMFIMMLAWDVCAGMTAMSVGLSHTLYIPNEPKRHEVAKNFSQSLMDIVSCTMSQEP